MFEQDYSSIGTGNLGLPLVKKPSPNAGLIRTSKTPAASRVQSTTVKAKGAVLDTISNSSLFVVQGLKDGNGNQLIVSGACAQALKSPFMDTYLSRRLVQESAFLAFQVWLWVSAVQIIGPADCGFRTHPLLRRSFL